MPSTQTRCTFFSLYEDLIEQLQLSLSHPTELNMFNLLWIAKSETAMFLILYVPLHVVCKSGRQ